MRPRPGRAIHALEPLEDRFCMSAAVVEGAATDSASSSFAKFAPVYAQLSNGQTVRLGYIEYHTSLDLVAAAAAAANARGDGSSTVWKPSLTPDGLILLTPVASGSRDPQSSGGTGRASGVDSLEFLPSNNDPAASDFATKRSAVLDALADAPMTSHADDVTVPIAHVQTTHPKDDRPATAGAAKSRPARPDALARRVGREGIPGTLAASAGQPMASMAHQGFLAALRDSATDWTANVLLARVHVSEFAARAAGRATAGAATAAAGLVAPVATTQYFGFSHLDLPYTLAVDSIAAFAEESAHLSAAVGSRARSALAVSERGAAWGFTLAVLAADLALVGYIYRGTARDRDAAVLPPHPARSRE